MPITKDSLSFRTQTCASNPSIHPVHMCILSRSIDLSLSIFTLCRAWTNHSLSQNNKIKELPPSPFLCLLRPCLEYSLTRAFHSSTHTTFSSPLTAPPKYLVKRAVTPIASYLELLYSYSTGHCLLLHLLTCLLTISNARFRTVHVVCRSQQLFLMLKTAFANIRAEWGFTE